MKRAIALFTMMMFVAGTASATSVNATEEFDSKMVRKLYNQNSDEVPPVIKSLINGEVVNVHLSPQIDEFNVSANNSTVGFRMAENDMTEFQTEPYKNSTLDIYITAENIDTIKNSKEPVEKAADMVGDEIRYESHEFETDVKMKILEFTSEVVALSL